MLKYRIPALDWTSLNGRKKKRDEADVERSLEKPQVGISSAKIQIETNILEHAFPKQPPQLQLIREGFQN